MPEERYGFIGNGYRLAPFNTRNDGTMPEVAYDGFKWCGLGAVTATTEAVSINVPGLTGWREETAYVFRVTPRDISGIYIADNGAFERRRKELFAAIKPRDQLTDEELSEAMLARGRTIMPVADYALMVKADPSKAYTEAVILVKRELSFDEVELISGPWPEASFVQLIANHSEEARAMLDRIVALHATYYTTFNRNDSAALESAIKEMAANRRLKKLLTGAAESYSRQTYIRREVVHFLTRVVDSAAESRSLGLW
jgi:hypothetical protein